MRVKRSQFSIGNHTIHQPTPKLKSQTSFSALKMRNYSHEVNEEVLSESKKKEFYQKSLRKFFQISPRLCVDNRKFFS